MTKKRISAAAKLTGLGTLFLMMFNFPFLQAFSGWTPGGIPAWWLAVMGLWLGMVVTAFWIVEGSEKASSGKVPQP